MTALERIELMQRSLPLHTVSVAPLALAFVTLGFGWAPAALAQQDPEPEQPEAETEVSPQIWVDYNPSWWLAERVELFGDVGVRTDIGNDE